jgi:hypothetical protein
MEGAWEFLRAAGVSTAGALISFVAALIAVRWRRQGLIQCSALAV